MKLSVIIVNYNVRHFLEQALLSVEKAVTGMDAEVFVVDNNSVDNSVEMVYEKFPGVKVISNKENLGFSKANNQAILQSKGEYVLLLNPDTVLQDDSLEKCCNFMDQHPDCGGLGVRMIDGKGKFLPESKRGLPTPMVALYKMTGLSALFPKSRVFGRYHLKYLPEFETHSVDVLSGAFMMLRKSVLDKTGLLDETFFMYGEDIDLSFRITQEGYKNYYFPETTIIHYKGESTKKKSANYVKVFYNAMVLFAKKHYSNKMAGWFAFFISIAVKIRALAAMTYRLMAKMIYPILDFIIIYAGFFGIARYWEIYNKYVRGFYPDLYYLIHIPGYIFIILTAVFLSGGYDKPLTAKRLLRGVLTGPLVVFVIYAFLPKSMQFSRAILLLGSAWAVLALPALRILLNGIRRGKFEFGSSSDQRIVIIANEKESQRIQNLITRSGVQYDFLGFVSADHSKPAGFLGDARQAAEIAAIFNINQVIFSAADLSASEIMETMSRLSGSEVNFKIVPNNSAVIIGSNSKNESGELYAIDIKFSLADKQILRKKRIFDISAVLAIWIFSLPLLLLNKGRKLLLHSFLVFIGNQTFVSYQNQPDSDNLPEIKSGLINPGLYYNDSQLRKNANFAYAKEYSVQKDIQLLLKYVFK